MLPCSSGLWVSLEPGKALSVPWGRLPLLGSSGSSAMGLFTALPKPFAGNAVEGMLLSWL